MEWLSFRCLQALHYSASFMLHKIVGSTIFQPLLQMVYLFSSQNSLYAKCQLHNCDAPYVILCDSLYLIFSPLWLSQRIKYIKVHLTSFIIYYLIIPGLLLITSIIFKIKSFVDPLIQNNNLQTSEK